MYAGQMFALTNVQLVPVLLSVLLLAAVTSSILLLKNRLETADTMRKEVITANRVKHDPEIFIQLLRRKEDIDTNPFSKEITLGDREAPVQILMAANLHCNPCRIAFDTVRQIRASYPQKVCFSFRLTKGMDNTIGELSASTYLISYWQQFIHGSKKEAERTKKLLFDWYSQMNPEVFSKTYPLHDGKVIGSNREELENLHYEWVEQNEINRTPTFFINGYKMPQNYRIKDLMEMIPGLEAQLKNSDMIMQGPKKEIA
jgi:hypothetical protein